MVMLRVGLLLLVCSLSATAGPVYKVVKEDGTVIYTDTPVAGAEKVSLPRANTAEPLSRPMPQSARSKKTQTATSPAESKPDYQLTISQPQPEANIRNNAGNLTIMGQMEPEPDGGEYLLLLDGNIIHRGSSPQFALENVDRGQHEVQIQYSDSSGKILASSPKRVFYLHRFSILHQNQQGN